jgi:hypothetical protein
MVARSGAGYRKNVLSIDLIGPALILSIMPDIIKQVPRCLNFKMIFVTIMRIVLKSAYICSSQADEWRHAPFYLMLEDLTALL